MTAGPSPIPHLSLGVTGHQALELVDSHELRERWSALPLAFTVLGIDRLASRSEPGSVALEPTVAATYLATVTTGTRLVVPTKFGRDHPYNLARRIASAGHLTAGRIGVLVGGSPDSESGDPWLDPTESRSPDAGRKAQEDAAIALRILEQSWPYDSVVADRGQGVFVHSERIDLVNLTDSYRIAGPLTIPEPATGPAVIGWFATSGTPAPAVADFVVGDDIVIANRDGGIPNWPGAPSGVVLVGRVGEPLPELLDAAAGLIGDRVRESDSGPLRAALGLAIPPRTLRPNPAFPLANSGASR